MVPKKHTHTPAVTGHTFQRRIACLSSTQEVNTIRTTCKKCSYLPHKLSCVLCPFKAASVQPQTNILDRFFTCKYSLLLARQPLHSSKPLHSSRQKVEALLFIIRRHEVQTFRKRQVCGFQNVEALLFIIRHHEVQTFRKDKCVDSKSLPI